MKIRLYASIVGGKTEPVGQRICNRWGLFNVHGNVSEWCYDLYGKHKDKNVTDPINVSSDQLQRVIRGGDFTSLTEYMCRISRRNWNAAYLRTYMRGFRIALAATR